VKDSLTYYTVYRYDFIRRARESIGLVLERRRWERGKNNENLLKLAQRLYPTSSLDSQIVIIPE